MKENRYHLGDKRERRKRLTTNQRRGELHDNALMHSALEVRKSPFFPFMESKQTSNLVRFDDFTFQTS